jgi:HlyD family secretion protein
MKRAWKFFIAALIVVLVISALALRVKRALHHAPTPPRTVLTRLGSIDVVVEETGTIAPEDKIDVKSKVAGRILSLPIQEGEHVQAGQLIATIDRTLIDPQITQTTAQLNQAQAHLQQTIAAYHLQVIQTRMSIAEGKAGVETAKTHLAAVAAGPRPQEVGQQQQAVQRAKISLDDAERTNGRDQALLAKGFIPQSQADTAQVALDTARSTLDAAKQSLSLTKAGPRVQDVQDAQAQVDTARVQLAAAEGNILQNAVSRSDIAQAQASVAQIAGSLSQLEVQAHDTRIIAPASGTVLKAYKQEGEIVQSATTGFSDAQSIIATIGSRGEVDVDINEVDITQVHLGAPVTITVDAVPNTSYSGIVTAIAPASTDAFSTDGTTTTTSTTSSISKFAVAVSFNKTDSRLRPGMTADVSIQSAHASNAVLIPLEAIAFTGNTGTVQVLDAAGHAQPHSITLGMRNDVEAEVTHGLKPGQSVVVPPLDGHRRTIDFGGG